MKRLYLLRHAKSAWPAGVSDHERMLAPRGHEAAPLIAAYMVREGFIPDLTLVSSARRTMETFSLVNEVLGECRHVVKPEIYEASPEDLLELIHKTPADVKSLMLVGHNPGIGALSMMLTHEDKSNPAAIQHLNRNFPTAGLAVFNIPNVDWQSLQFGQANLRQFITPKLLGGVDEN